MDIRQAIRAKNDRLSLEMSRVAAWRIRVLMDTTPPEQIKREFPYYYQPVPPNMIPPRGSNPSRWSVGEYLGRRYGVLNHGEVQTSGRPWRGGNPALQPGRWVCREIESPLFNRGPTVELEDWVGWPGGASNE